MKIQYIERKFSQRSLETIDVANDIINEYRADGFILTLRQLYYQFVARGLIENTLRSYKRLGSVVNDARLAGLVDWSAIEDRTRNLVENPHWWDPREIIASSAYSFRIDKWEGQPRRVEVWIEKEALAGVIADVCEKLDVPFFACRGYPSQSEMWGAGQRLADYDGDPIIIHLGDHDPSGVDMTRDIEDRLAMFAERHVEVNRIALNMDQIEEYGPPPNPAKITDSRSPRYVRQFGRSSWELDALEPRTLAALVEDEVCSVRDEDLWEEAVKAENVHREQLSEVSGRWSEVCDYLGQD